MIEWAKSILAVIISFGLSTLPFCDFSNPPLSYIVLLPRLIQWSNLKKSLPFITQQKYRSFKSLPHLSASFPAALTYHLQSFLSRNDLMVLIYIYHLRQCCSNWSVCHDHLEGLSKSRLLGPTPTVSDSVGLGWGLRTYISNK